MKRFPWVVLLGALAPAFAPLASAAGPQQYASAALNADVNDLMATLEEVHPDLYFKTSREKVAGQLAIVRGKLDQPMSRAEFFEALGPFVNQLADGHTRLFAPPRRSASSAKAPATVNPELPDEWKFRMLQDNTAYLDFAGMDRPLLDRWRAFLQQTFTEIAAKHSRRLIVDLRHNGGGASDLGDELLNYITAQPYRPITQKTWKMSGRYLGSPDGQVYWTAVFPNDVLAIPADGSVVDLESYFAQNPPAALKRLLRDHASPKGRDYLERHAPDWLNPEISHGAETRELSFRIKGYRTPPASFPLRFPGRTCFLVGPKTFSSAIILGDSVKTFHLATIAGEETPPCNQFGEVMKFRLPNSGLEGMVPSAQFVRANGDSSDPHGIIPDVPCTQSAHDSQQGIDTVLETARRWLAQPGSSNRCGLGRNQLTAKMGV